MGRLAGKVALISGTAGGMGRAAAIEFAAQGAKVAGCDINAEGDAETEALVRNAGGVMKSFAPVDLTDEAAARAWVDGAVAEFGGVDVLYNNASVARVGPWDELDYDEWRRSITYELDLVYLCTKAAWPYLVERGEGCVINVASVSAVRGAGFVHQHAHGAAKGGVLAFTKHLMVSGIPHNIRAVSISPGMIRTPATSPVIDIPGGPLAQLIASTPSRRVGEPHEVAKLASFLASDEATYINGADIAIDGGATAIAP
ncbi:MAG TPA: SDR family NAD(P)-dependent oxidoreductase [Solirubrobacteraceae bacterium]|jgi:NAD(P)-dependent dehydrogenase (short-subunit alcohol dehydrogenase family)|nr:SDR family NAD(P)-dependent oxidoreductase [Solirubrobacteraceae bacterium]